MKTKILTISLVALFFAVLTAVSREQVSGKPAESVVQAQTQTQSMIQSLTAQEYAWADSCRRIAPISRQMAARSDSDSASVRELKRQYGLLADNEEKAADAAEKMADEHARLLESVIYRSEPPLSAEANPEK
jgi:hypothetical protein